MTKNNISIIKENLILSNKHIKKYVKKNDIVNIKSISCDFVKMTVSNYDTETDIDITIPSKNEGELSVSIPFSLIESVTKLTDKNTFIVIENDKIWSVKNKISLNMPFVATKYPSINEIHDKSFSFICEIDSNQLKRVNDCASKDVTREVLNGVFIEWETENIVGTDGKRLHIEKLKYPINKIEDHKNGIIIPSHFIKKIPNNIKMQLSVSSPYIFIGTFDDKNIKIRIASKKIFGDYPKYELCIPDDTGIGANISPDILEMINSFPNTITCFSFKNENAIIDIKDKNNYENIASFNVDAVYDDGILPVAIDTVFLIDAFKLGGFRISHSDKTTHSRSSYPMSSFFSGKGNTHLVMTYLIPTDNKN